jgi:hypothetical protein
MIFVEMPRVFTVLSLDVWDILIAELPSSKVGNNAIQSGSCADLKGDAYDH